MRVVEDKIHVTFLWGSLEERTWETKRSWKLNIKANLKETWPQDKAQRIA
jgi:hypothetical protein